MKKLFVAPSWLLFPICVSLAVCQGSLDQRLADLSLQIAQEMSANKKTTIAVIEFSDLRGNITDMGRYLAEELVTRLFQTRKFKVIERQLLTKIITEQKLSLTGVIDPVSAKELGKLLGVDAIASGSVADLATSLKVNARLISTQTGEVFSVASVEIAKDSQVERLLEGRTSGPEMTSPQGSGTSTTVAIQRLESKGFSFEIVSCRRRDGGSVSCQVQVTNISEVDRKISVYAAQRMDMAARLFDEFHDAYLAHEVVFGEKSSSNEVRQHLLSGFKMTATWDFQKVTPEATTVSVLDLGIWTDGPFRVKFENIPIR